MVWMFTEIVRLSRERSTCCSMMIRPKSYDQMMVFASYAMVNGVVSLGSSPNLFGF
jgi:hypothetical protein